MKALGLMVGGQDAVGDGGPDLAGADADADSGAGPGDMSPADGPSAQTPPEPLRGPPQVVRVVPRGLQNACGECLKRYTVTKDPQDKPFLFRTQKELEAHIREDHAHLLVNRTVRTPRKDKGKGKQREEER